MCSSDLLDGKGLPTISSCLSRAAVLSLTFLLPQDRSGRVPLRYRSETGFNYLTCQLYSSSIRRTTFSSLEFVVCRVFDGQAAGKAFVLPFFLSEIDITAPVLIFWFRLPTISHPATHSWLSHAGVASSSSAKKVHVKRRGSFVSSSSGD